MQIALLRIDGRVAFVALNRALGALGTTELGGGGNVTGSAFDAVGRAGRPARPFREDTRNGARGGTTLLAFLQRKRAGGAVLGELGDIAGACLSTTVASNGAGTEGSPVGHEALGVARGGSASIGRCQGGALLATESILNLDGTSQSDRTLTARSTAGRRGAPGRNNAVDGATNYVALARVGQLGAGDTTVRSVNEHKPPLLLVTRGRHTVGESVARGGAG